MKRSHKIMGIIFALFVTLISAGFYFAESFTVIPVYRKASYEVYLNLDPLKATATAENMLTNLIYEGLVTIDDALRVKPQLAENWEIRDDGKHYIFNLRKNVFFHDGCPMKSKDVVTSLKRLQMPNNKAVIDSYKVMSEVYAEGDHVVHIKLKSAYPAFLSTLAAPPAKISKPHSANGYHLGTGTFKYQGIVSREGRRVLVLSAARKGNRFHPKIQKMEIWELDEVSAIEMAKKGFIHDTAIYTTKTREARKDLPVVETLAPAAVTWIFSMNTAKAPFNNLTFRRCLDSNFNKADMVKKFIPEQGVAKGLLPPTLSGSQINAGQTKVSAVECKNQFLGTNVTLDYPAGLRNGREMCEYFRNDMTKIGVGIKCIGQQSFNELLDRIKKKKSGLSFLGMTLDSPDVEYFFNTFESKSELNISNYTSKKIDSLLARGRLEQNKTKRAEIFSEINHELFKNVVTINISYPWHISYRHKCLEDFFVGLAGDSFINYSIIKMNPMCFRRGDFTNG